MTPLQRKQEFYRQLTLAKKTLKSKNFQMSFSHLENAHVLGQKHVYRHTLSHYWMLVYGIKTNSSKEIIGQLFRIITSILLVSKIVKTMHFSASRFSF